MSNSIITNKTSGGKTQLGRFLVKETLGRGVATVVFKVHDRQKDKDLVIKVLHKSQHATIAEFHKRFAKEIRAASGLNHPNIASIYDIGIDGGKPFIVMELVPGRSLDKVLAWGVMPQIEAVEIGIQLATALDYAHGKGVVHCDIKPANVMLLPNSNFVKITDFGIAKSLGSENNRAITQSFTAATRYMSPEQCGRLKPDGRSDLFSLGALLYELLSGQPPFTAENFADLLRQIVEEPHTPLALAIDDLPLPLTRIVDRLLAKNPKHRFQTGAEVAAALLASLPSMRQIPVLDTPMEPPPLTKAVPARKSRKMLALVCVAAIAGGWYLWPRSVTTPQPAAPTAAQLIKDQRQAEQAAAEVVRQETERLRQETERLQQEAARAKQLEEELENQRRTTERARLEAQRLHQSEVSLARERAFEAAQIRKHEENTRILEAQLAQQRAETEKARQEAERAALAATAASDAQAAAAPAEETKPLAPEPAPASPSAVSQKKSEAPKFKANPCATSAARFMSSCQ